VSFSGVPWAGLHTVSTNVKHTSVEVEPDVRLHVAEQGAGPLVVLLHGFPDGWELWQSLQHALAEAGFRALAVEQRGYPRSDQPHGIGRYRITRLAADVAAVIEHYGADTAAVVGHDFGGGVAWAFAMAYPQRLDRLVIVNAPHPRRFVQSLRTLGQLRKSWYMAAMQLPWLPERVTGAPTGAVNWYRALRFGGPAITRIDDPVLVIWGERDPYLGRELAQPYPTDVPNAQLVRLETAGHWPQREQPEQVNALITAFLRQP